ncbi:MAG: 50S ribosomal protein L10 [Candidatus Nanohalarchaeota archaeon]|nr:MAG: 50S ribosomal protein L10 [Candidatus Nanohaloarchaeota archaeon]
MVQEWKLKKVKELTEEIEKSPVVGMLDLDGLGAAQLQQMRKDTRDSAKIIVTKKTVITRAIDNSKKENIKDLNNQKSHIPALIISKDNAFKLYKRIDNSKSEAYAKAGNIAPMDITVPAGETNLPPGPVISDLQKAGLKAMIKGNKIAIREDSLLVKEGEEISEIKANVMMKLDIKPMEVGLNILAVHEENMVFSKETLAIDTEQYITDLQTAYTQGFNLAYNADIFIKEIMPQKIQEAQRNAMNLAINAEIANKETITPIIQKSNSEMQSLASQLPKDARGSATIIQQNTAPAEQPKQEPEKKEEEKPKSDEEAASGLGALFG